MNKTQCRAVGVQASIIETKKTAPLTPSITIIMVVVFNMVTSLVELPLQFLFPQNPNSNTNPIPKRFQNPNLIQSQFRPQFSRETNTTTSSSDRGLIFREKVLYLEKLNVNPQKAFRVNPNLRSTPLSTLKSAEQCLSSMGIPRSAMGRILDMLPDLLNRDPNTDLYPILDFLLNEVGIPYPDVRKSITRCPRILLCSVENQLRPTLSFLKEELGFTGSYSLTCQNTVLLVSSVEGTFVPKIEFLKGLGLTRVEVGNMVVRSPGLLTFSIEKNLRPKSEYFLKEMNGDVAELKRFPQYFSFSLERRIRPRHRLLVQHGLSLPLHLMLMGDEGGFHETLFNTRLRKLE